jgi:hypothetical protein
MKSIALIPFRIFPSLWNCPLTPALSQWERVRDYSLALWERVRVRVFSYHG